MNSDNTGQPKQSPSERIAELEAEIRGMKADMDEHETAEAALRASESKYRALLENLPEGVFAKDTNSVFTTCNRHLAEMMGTTPEDIVGKTDLDFFPKELAEHYRRDDRRIMASGLAEVIEETFVDTDGKEHSIHTAKAALKDQNGKVTGVLGIFWDVTEKKAADEAIRLLSEEARRRSVELEAANMELEAFSYSVSHDLRAPLRTIDGFSQALIEDCGDAMTEEDREYLERIRTACARMEHLIDDLLRLSRVTRTEMHRRDVNLSEMAERIAADLQQAEPERRVSFDIQPGVIANADEQLVFIVLENLIGNAWKFTSGASEVRIEFGETDLRGERVFYVRDNGAGFDMAYVGKLFAPFQRLHSAEEFPGTGIGLAIVARVIRRHGGRVWAEGAPGKGATFYFTPEEEEIATGEYPPVALPTSS